MLILSEDENVTDEEKTANPFRDLHEKEYIEVLKNLLEVPKYLVSLIFFLTTITAAVARLKPELGALEKSFFVVGVGASLVAAILGYRLVAHILNEMPKATLKDERSVRYADLMRGPYSQFVKVALVPILAWIACLTAVMVTGYGPAPTRGIADSAPPLQSARKEVTEFAKPLLAGGLHCRPACRDLSSAGP